MSAELIAKMRGRIEKCRRLANMINDPVAEHSLLQMAHEIEADMNELQVEETARHSEELKMPPQTQG